MFRYANFAIHPKQTNLLVTLREDHTNDKDFKQPGNVLNTICVVDTTASTPTVNIIIQDADFYATPVLSPLGDKIAWQQWNLPDMPWEGGIIYVAGVSVDSGSLKVKPDAVLVAGAAATKSATFPSWIGNTTLAYTTDEYNKYQNPYIFDTDKQQATPVLNTPLTQDFAEPAWWLGLYPFAILGGGSTGVFTAFKDGGNILYIVDLATSSDPVQIENFDFTVAQHVRAASENTFVFTGSKTTAPGGVILGTVSGSPGAYTVEFTTLKSADDVSGVEFKTLKANQDDGPDVTKYISPPIPKTVSIPGGHPIYVVYYAPYSPDYSGPSDPNEKPPCVLNVHGGPTGLESQALNWTKQFYTSRGFAW